MGKKATKALEKRLKFHEYKAMIDRDLTRALINRKSELFAYSFQIKTGSLKKTHLIRVIKTEIAWILTILRQRNINVDQQFGTLSAKDVNAIAEQHISQIGSKRTDPDKAKQNKDTVIKKEEKKEEKKEVKKIVQKLPIVESDKSTKLMLKTSSIAKVTSQITNKVK